MGMNEAMEKMPQEKAFSISEAMSRITALMQIEMQKGATDFEPDQFRSIMARLEERAITPETALSEAQKIAMTRQDYH